MFSLCFLRASCSLQQFEKQIFYAVAHLSVSIRYLAFLMIGVFHQCCWVWFVDLLGPQHFSFVIELFLPKRQTWIFDTWHPAPILRVARGISLWPETCTTSWRRQCPHLACRTDAAWGSHEAVGKGKELPWAGWVNLGVPRCSQLLRGPPGTLFSFAWTCMFTRSNFLLPSQLKQSGWHQRLRAGWAAGELEPCFFLCHLLLVSGLASHTECTCAEGFIAIPKPFRPAIFNLLYKLSRWISKFRIHTHGLFYNPHLSFLPRRIHIPGCKGLVGMSSLRNSHFVVISISYI